MTIATGESEQISLSVLGSAVGTGDESERGLTVLQELGLSSPSLELANAVTVALSHATYRYEYPTAFPGVTEGLLDALSALGLAFLRRLAALNAYKRAASATAGTLSRQVAQVAAELPAWADQQEWVLKYAALGRNFSEVRPPAKVPATLLRQVLGVLCLAGEETAAGRLAEGLLAEVSRQQFSTVADPKTVLQEAIAPSTATYTYEREGPDHKIVFRATVTDTRGRRGIGVGSSKKLAARNAALDFLHRYIPQALSAGKSASTSRLLPVAIPEPQTHASAVQRLRNLFVLPTSAAALLSQTLIHTSWAYEHRLAVTRYHQQDNQVLAFVGAEVAIYESTLAAVRQAVADPPPEFAFRGLDNVAYNNAFHRTGLTRGLLLGTGQASMGISAEMGATAFQAIIGATGSASWCYVPEWGGECMGA